MIIKFFRQKQSGAIEYLTNSKLHPDVKVMRGWPRLTKRIYEGLRGSQHYCAGVIAEDGLMIDSVQVKIMDAFESVLGAGLDPGEFNITWIRHQDRGRTELHFVVPSVLLGSGRSWAPYVDRIDRPPFAILRGLLQRAVRLGRPTGVLKAPGYKGNDVLRKAGRRQELLEAIDGWWPQRSRQAGSPVVRI